MIVIVSRLLISKELCLDNVALMLVTWSVQWERVHSLTATLAASHMLL